VLGRLLRVFLSRHFIVYCVIGVSGVSLDMALFWLLVTYAGLHYEIAHFFGVSLGITNNFLWNALVNFKVKDRLLARYAQFYGVGMVGMATGGALLWLFVELGHVPVMASKGLVVFFVTVLQYSLNVRMGLKKPAATP
jgi:dolichol-phosphate mannosyltransferase